MSDQTVTLEYFKSLTKSPTALLIDVREPGELSSTGQIPGSINIPLATLENVLKNTPSAEFAAKYNKEKPNFDTELVFSCQSGRRSLAALDLAIKLGYNKAKHYPGGWLGWQAG